MYGSFVKLKGRKIFEKKSKKYFGRLSDVIVNKDTNKIIGIVSKNDSPIYKYRYFKIGDVCGFDEVNVYVTGFGEKYMKVLPVNESFKSCENDIFKRKAVYPDGTGAGRVQNIKLSLEAGEIIGLEIGSTIIEDLLTGRKICPTKQKISYFKDKIVLDEN